MIPRFRLRGSSSNSCAPLMVRWHSVEVFAIQPSCCATYYVATPSCWQFFVGHDLLPGATPHVPAYFSNYIINDHTCVRLLWRIVMLEVTVCTITAFLCLARDGALVPEVCSGPLPPCHYGIVLSLAVCVCEALVTIGLMVVLHETIVDMSLGYKAYCQS